MTSLDLIEARHAARERERTPAHFTEIMEALRAPSLQQDTRWHSPDAKYATKPKALLSVAADVIEELWDDYMRLLREKQDRPESLSSNEQDRPTSEEAR